MEWAMRPRVYLELIDASIAWLLSALKKRRKNVVRWNHCSKA